MHFKLFRLNFNYHILKKKENRLSASMKYRLSSIVNTVCHDQGQSKQMTNKIAMAIKGITMCLHFEGRQMTKIVQRCFVRQDKIVQRRKFKTVLFFYVY